MTRCGFDAICRAVLGEGHFLGAAETHGAMERDYVYPRIADRNPPVTWAEAGAQTAWDRARSVARQILAEHHPDHLSPDADAAIRAAFPILL